MPLLSNMDEAKSACPHCDDGMMYSETGLWADAWWNDNQGTQVVKQGRRAGLLPSDVTKKWIDVGIPGRVAHAMAKKHYSDQNFRVDRICRLRAALEDHILEIKRQITEGIDINEPEGEREVRRQVLGRPIFRHCLSIAREKKPDLARPKEGWVGAGNLGSMERADLGYTSEDEEVPQDKKPKQNAQPSFQSLIQEHERRQCERCGDTPAWSRTSGTLMTGDRCNLHSPDRQEESEDRCENCGGEVYQKNGLWWANRNKFADPAQNGICNEHQQVAAGAMTGTVVNSQGTGLGTSSIKWAPAVQKGW